MSTEPDGNNQFDRPDGSRCSDEHPPEEHVLGQYIPLLYHYNMLQDEDRVSAFRDAINLLVQSGMHVVELGGGTGILSSLAARRGANVTCIERNPELVACAERFLRLNDLHEQVRVVHADAMQFVPDQPVDIVVCEMLHVGLLREKQAQVIAAFKQNYARAFDGTLPVFVPEVSILMAQPVQQSFDFFGYEAPVPLFQAPLLDQPRTKDLATLEPYANIAYDDTIPMNFDVQQSVMITDAGQLNAVRFVTQNVLAVDVRGQRAITWPNQCLVLPLESRFDVTANQSVELSFRYASGGSIESLSETLRCDASAAPATPRAVPDTNIVPTP